MPGPGSSNYYLLTIYPLELVPILNDGLLSLNTESAAAYDPGPGTSKVFKSLALPCIANDGPPLPIFIGESYIPGPG